MQELKQEKMLLNHETTRGRSKKKYKNEILMCKPQRKQKEGGVKRDEKKMGKCMIRVR